MDALWADRAQLQGLSEADAERRLASSGPNVIPEAKPHPAWRLLIAELTHFFALMLWVAAALAFLGALPVLGTAIIVVILVNGVFAFVQERRAERAAEALRTLIPLSATVIRDGEQRIVEAWHLVIGDLVVLEPGDRVSADGVVIDTHTCAIDCSMLTGESEPEAVALDSTVFAGTFAVDGRAVMEVTQTGAETRLAAIAALTRRARRPRSPLTLELNRVVRIIAMIAIAVGVVCFGLAIGLGMPISAGFLFAIGVTVALVPEGLLPTVTVSLAIGAQRMADHRVLVRRLEAVETLGSTTVICTDKTGTLTCNEMTVVRWWTPAGVVEIDGTGYGPTAAVTGTAAARGAAADAARIAADASTATVSMINAHWEPVGDPTEGALVAAAMRLAATQTYERAVARAHYPFDPIRRRMSVLVGENLYVKGAPDVMLAACVDVPSGAQEAIDAWAGEGLRLIVVARRRWPDPAPFESEPVERNLTFVGVAALEDPPRAEVAAAIAAARGAGIAVLMVTGDHPKTAAAIAREVGLALPESPVFLGDDLPTDGAALAALLNRDGTVVARVDPETKLRIAQALQRSGSVVAMTGDGVNDGPALQAADIGVAMGGVGTDIARAAADIVLLDDNFTTIVDAIRQGRATYFNVRRFLTYHLSANVAELLPFVVWALSGTRIPLAIGVLQVLAIDIGTDLIPAMALGAEPASSYALQRPPPTLHLLDRHLLARVFGVLGAAVASWEMIVFIVMLVSFGWDFVPDAPRTVDVAMASGAAFLAVAFGQAGTALACRSSSRRSWQLQRHNPYLGRALIAEAVIVLALVCIPPIARAFGQAVPPWWGWLLAACALPVVLTADTWAKAILARRRHARAR